MSYPVSLLIANSFYISGVYSRRLETIDGADELEGLALLNELLSFKTSDQRFIPYYTYDQTVDCVIGQEIYFIENLVSADTVSFYYGPIRYPMMLRSRKDYFGTGRADNIQALPYDYHIERVKGGANLYLYFFPQQTFQLNIMGKFSLTNVALGDDLEEFYDPFYIRYLKYILAKEICINWQIDMPPQSLEQLKEVEETVMDTSAIDLTMIKMSSLTKGKGINWAIVNLSEGWVPVS